MKLTRNLCILLTIFSMGCATLFSDKTYNYSFDSDPKGATVTVLNSGFPVGKVKTPGSMPITLKKDYIIRFELPGYETQNIILDKDLDMWFLGNLLCGGVIGMVVDFVTGAMWKPARMHINWTFQPDTKSSTNNMPVYRVRMELMGNNSRRAIAETLMKPGTGERYAHLVDLVTEVH